jgi:hypothetical protein
MNFNNVDLLTIVEEWATSESLPGSEEALSEMFDQDVAPFVLQVYSSDDSVAFNEEFNNWSDGLRDDGIIHEEQYSNYCYVGKYSGE